jgi:ribose transport system permease protein
VNPPDHSSETAAVRLSGDEDVTGRIISDSGDPAEPSEPPTRVTLRSQYEPKWLHTLTSKYALVLVWAAMSLVYYILMPHTFGSIGAVRAIFGGQPVLVFLAMSALITLLVAEFDLSVASIMGLSATIVPVLAGLHGVNVWVACLIALAACACAGAVNAFFVVYLDVSSFVVTLGTGTLLIGLSQWLSSSNVVSIQDDAFGNLSLLPVLGMPVSFYYGIALALLIAYVLAFTPLGRHMLFVGANREVARLAGIRVNGIRTGAYIVSSLLAGFSGIILVSTLGGFDSTTSGQFLLPALAAVFLGTTVVQPGQFNPIGTMIAIWFLWTGIFGLQLLGFAGWVQNVFYGAGLVVAVALAKIVRNRSRTS